jgi:DNA-binding FadR family transcriptional regulator
LADELNVANPGRAGLTGFASQAGPQSAQSQIAEALGTDIVSGVYPPGANLPHETDLLARFAVSRPVLREVLKTLAAKGLVVSKTKIGTRVRPRSDWNFFDPDVLLWKVRDGLDDDFQGHLLDLRRVVEPLNASLAAVRRTEEDLARLRACVAAMASTEHGKRSFAEADAMFHVTLADVSGNPLMRSMAAAIETALLAAFARSSAMDNPAQHKLTVEGHAAIVDAVAERDPVAASDAMLRVIALGAERPASPAGPSESERREPRASGRRPRMAVGIG